MTKFRTSVPITSLPLSRSPQKKRSDGTPVPQQMKPTPLCRHGGRSALIIHRLRAGERLDLRKCGGQSNAAPANTNIGSVMKCGYLIDMDGVIYRENQLIAGAADFVRALHATGTPFIFLTNNSAPTPQDLAVRLEHLGIAGLSPRHFYTSALNTADFLTETDPACTVFVLGEGGLLTALHERQIANDAIEPRYVVVGEGNATTEKLGKAHECLERGARLLATNPDNWCPVSSEKTRPGAGATVAFLEASTGKRAYYLGKPNGYMFQRARRRLAEITRTEPEQVVMIGDTMETDIRGAVESGMQSFLVLSGSTRLEEVGDYVYQPTRVLQSVADLTEEVRTGQPSDHRTALMLSTKSTQGTKYGQRHQTDVFALHKPRPRPAMTK